MNSAYVHVFEILVSMGCLMNLLELIVVLKTQLFSLHIASGNFKMLSSFALIVTARQYCANAYMGIARKGALSVINPVVCTVRNMFLRFEMNIVWPALKHAQNILSVFSNIHKRSRYVENIHALFCAAGDITLTITFIYCFFSTLRMQARNQLPTLLQHQTRASQAAVRQLFIQLVILRIFLEISFVCSLS